METQTLWTARQKQRVMALAHKDCCNYDRPTGECLMMDGFGCALDTSLHLCCNYFRDCVLPLDKALQAEILGDSGTRKCQRCGKAFSPGSNRAKYCVKCAEEVHRIQKNASARNLYATNPDN